MKAFLPLLLFALVGAAGPGTGGPGSGGLRGPGSSGPGATLARTDPNVTVLRCSGTSCSDGRLIATARSTPVPCEQQQGVLGEVPANVACVNWDGRLDAYGPNTTLLSDGADLSKWSANNGIVVTSRSGHTQIARPDGGSTAAAVAKSIPVLTANETRTHACRLRATNGSDFYRMAMASGSLPATAVGAEWETVSYTRALAAGDNPTFYLYPGQGGGTGPFASLDVAACWHTATATPGRMCVGTNAAGTTCAADVHTVSTAGFPTETGEVCMTAQIGETTEAFQYVFDGRIDTSTPSGPYVARTNPGNNILVGTGGSTWANVPFPVDWTRPHRYCVSRRDGRSSVTIDGVLVTPSVATAAWSWPSELRLGARFSGTNPLNGSITSLTVKTYTGGSCTGTSCTDGRTIATASATPRPCETAPGVWTDAPPNTACVNWRGELESWGANTTLIQNGNALTTSPWRDSPRGGSVEVITGGWRVTNAEGQANSGWSWTRADALTDGARVTAACRFRKSAGTLFNINPTSSGGTCNFDSTDTGGEFKTLSCTKSAGISEFRRVHLFVGSSTTVESVDVNGGCWWVNGDYPGRPCWSSNSSGTTCAADVHTISTAGWPTTNGRVAVGFIAGPTGNTRVILDGRVAVGSDIVLYLDSADKLTLNVAGTFLVSSSAVAPGPHVAEIVRQGTTTRLRLDGVEVATSSTAPVLSWQATARLGTSFAGASPLDGSFTRISWSTK